MFQKRWPENPLRPSSTGRLFNREPDANKGINREKQTKFCYGTARFGSRDQHAARGFYPARNARAVRLGIRADCALTPPSALIVTSSKRTFPASTARAMAR